MNKEYLNINCGVTIAHSIIQGKWKIVILNRLSKKTMRFGELHRSLPEIREGYLTKQLRELERDGIVHREVYKEVPPKVEYSLTEIGISLTPTIIEMKKWGKKYRELLSNSL